MVENIVKLLFGERLKYLQEAKPQELKQRQKRLIKPHIVYILSNPTVCGATKVILEHANHLVALGLNITLVSYGSQPKWYPTQAHYIEVPSRAKLSLLLPDCDLIVATYYTHIQDCIETGIAPVVYFEQGDAHLFDYENLEKSHRDFVYKQYQLPQFIMTVSGGAGKLILRYFQRESTVIPNAVDHSIFFPKKNPNEHTPYLLMMGRADVAYKGIQEILLAYKKLHKTYQDLDLVWVTPMITELNGISIISKIYENPKQEEIAKLYQNASVFISASQFESFSLPNIEAMSCGCPVISVANCGVLSYGKDGKNLLLYEKGNIEDLISKVEFILQDKHSRMSLIKNGLKTAEKLQWKASIPLLKEYLMKLSECEVEQKNESADWIIFVKPDEFYDLSGYKKFMKYLLNSKATHVYCAQVKKGYKWQGKWFLAGKRKEFIDENKKFCFVFLKNDEISSLDIITHQESLFMSLALETVLLGGVCMREIFDYAKELFENDVYEEALFFLDEYLRYQTQPKENRLQAYRMRYRAYYLKGDVAASRSACFSLFETLLPSFEECCFLGQTFLDESRVEEAIFWYETALRAGESGSMLEAHLQLCVGYYKKKELKKALFHHEQAKLICPEDESVMYNTELFSLIDQ